MYQIIKNGAVIALTEKPNYIRKLDNGAYTLTDESTAQGIAHDGTPYHLFGKPTMGEEETVLLVEVDAGKNLYETVAAQSDGDALAVDHEYRLALLELGVI